MTRFDIFARIKSIEKFDVVIIGGGASGLGVALDAISRGYKVLLVEKDDFGKGTSSKATKLLHGGVRYLAQGNIGLVYEALRERTNIIKNAPHLSEILPFIIPIYSYWDAIQYYIGLKFYDILAGKKSLGKSEWLSKSCVIEKSPNIKQKGLIGGVMYFDGQFDDTRLCIDLVTTIIKLGGLCINYTEFTSFLGKEKNFDGITILDKLTHQKYEIKSKAIVNASGVYFDKIMAKQHTKSPLQIVPSRGSHVILDRSFLASDHAIMIPKTSDGRVLFLIPWKTVVIIGTTDTVTHKIESDPIATKEDIAFILGNAQEYLTKKPTLSDIKSTYAGLRPLASPKGDGQKTKEISRSHKVLVTNKNLFSILGGKWTTFRKMGEDTLDKIIKSKILPFKPSESANISIITATQIENGNPIHHNLPYTWEYLESIIPLEQVEHVEDLLARRSRCIFIDKKATIQILDAAITLIANIKNKDEKWKIQEKTNFLQFAESF